MALLGAWLLWRALKNPPPEPVAAAPAPKPAAKRVAKPKV
jgi:hypothetical protein